MDAELHAERREGVSRRRQQRWSMNSQRLEEIVAELMKPVTGDLRRSFDTDLSALLEEYLTEAGLRALAAADGEGSGDEAPALPLPNFAELALLLQQSACIYGRKVDALHARVLAVCESLHHAASEIEAGEPGAAVPAEGAAVEGAAGAAAAARRGSAAARAAFAWIPLAAGGAAAAARAPQRAPPELPRALPELQPPPDAPLHADAPLHPLHTHYHVVWRLHEGLLVEELETGGAAAGGAQGGALDELRAALEARVPPEPLRLLPPLSPAPSPPAPSPPPAPLSPPLHASSPLPPPPPPTPPDRTRKRPSATASDLTDINLNIAIFKEGAWLASGLPGGEFTAGARWRRRVVRARSRRLRGRRAGGAREPADFKGFDSSAEDIGGFLGFSASETALAAASAVRSLAAAEAAELAATAAELAATAASAPEREMDSDDDGFFEQSSLGDSDASRLDDPAGLAVSQVRCNSFDSDASRLDDPAGLAVSQMSVAAEWARRAAADSADMRELARRVLRALPTPPAAAPAAALLRGRPRLLLAALLLANSGNVEVIPGPPLSMGAFQLRLLSADESRYSAAAADEQRAGGGGAAR